MNERPGIHIPPATRISKKTQAKDEINLLEPFSGLPHECIFVPASKEQFAEAVREIRAACSVGFDTETKPVFTKGVVNSGPDIVQFATKNRAFIFQLGRAECRAFLEELLQAEDILKIGFDLKSDRSLLLRKLGIGMRGVLDLCTVFRRKGYRNTIGVRSAVEIVLQRRFHKSKQVTTSNWALAQLAPKQLEYAANDANAALLVWLALGCPGPEKPSRRR
ncbi:MAG: 3'-5' exonuclease [Candidatus Ozemobacteraceae bacterium]